MPVKELTRLVTRSMHKGAIFDMDGVIVDSHPAHERSWRRLVLSMGKTVSEADLEFIREGRKRREIIERFLGDLSDEQIRTCYQAKDRLFQKEAENIRTVPGIRELLGELKWAGIPAAVASCGSRARVHCLLGRLQLNNHFVTVLTGDDVVQGKPDPEIFLKTAEHMGLRPSETVVFEDSVSGVLAASAAGMKCIGVACCQRGKALLEAGAAHVIPDFVGFSLAYLHRWFSSTHRQKSHEKSSCPIGFPKQTVPDLETR